MLTVGLHDLKGLFQPQVFYDATWSLDSLQARLNLVAVLREAWYFNFSVAGHGLEQRELGLGTFRLPALDQNEGKSSLSKIHVLQYWFQLLA